jgi:alkanesulfonate monooxygenase SsuD/methylene tetrahydromethanopterin reductase-like flavin-dependent oxidoreductase (luciferase family)
VSAGPAPLGVAFTGHWLPLDAALRLVARADALGFAQVLVDGDAALLPRGRPVYDATVLAAAALHASTRARVGAIHLAHFWSPLLLARNLATLQTLGDGRVVGLFGVGAGRPTGALGLPQPNAGERIERLDELLDQVRPLLAGESVTRPGRYASLEDAAITPPPQPVPLAVSAASPRALGLVRRHADIWDANVPPLLARLAPARETLGRALPTWLWVFARPGVDRDDALRDYRRHVPWFRDLPADEAAEAILWGEPSRCRERLARMRSELDLALPILDLAGLDEPDAARALEALAPEAPSSGMT